MYKFKWGRTVTRFWSRVKIRGLNECWPWQGRTGREGYGMFWVKDKDEVASRFGLRLKLGRKLRKGECSLHTCDNPPCCNPKHLFLGTRGENNTDRCQKGRNTNRRGRKNPQAKLSRRQVIKLRRMRKSHTLAELSRIFKVTDMTIHRTCTGELWGHIKEGLD